MLENGKLVEAEAEKLRLEQRQRSTRKSMADLGVAWKPVWFDKQKDGWIVKDDDAYWSARSAGFVDSGVVSIFE
jgi:hypothetical protein